MSPTRLHQFAGQSRQIWSSRSPTGTTGFQPVKSGLKACPRENGGSLSKRITTRLTLSIGLCGRLSAAEETHIEKVRCLASLKQCILQPVAREGGAALDAVDKIQYLWSLNGHSAFPSALYPYRSKTAAAATTAVKHGNYPVNIKCSQASARSGARLTFISAI